jgi:hypothetical protein
VAVDVLLLSPGPVPAALAGLDATRVRTGDGVVLPDRAFDVAVATSWEATAHLFSARAQRFAFWVDGFAHHRLGSWQAERIAAALAYDLPDGLPGRRPLGGRRARRPAARGAGADGPARRGAGRGSRRRRRPAAQCGRTTLGAGGRRVARAGGAARWPRPH